MTTIRERLECGYPEHAMEALLVGRGQTPLCCFKMVGSRMTCSWLKRMVTVQEFKRLCLRCQSEMTERLALGASSMPVRLGLDCVDHSFDNQQIEWR